MEQDNRAVPDPDTPEGGEEQGGEVAGDAGLASPAAPSEQEGASAADNAGGRGGAGPGSDGEEDLEEEALAEEEVVAPVGSAGHGDAPGSGQSEGHAAPESPAPPAAARVGFRGPRCAIARATPPSSRRRLPLRSRKQFYPARSTIARGIASSSGAVASVQDPGTSLAQPPSAGLGSASAATSARPAGVSAAANAGDGAENKALGSVARRSERSSDDGTTGTQAADAAASLRQPSRSRKRSRPDRFIPEDAAAARAKAHRSDAVLDRHFTSVTGTRPEWARDVMADDGGVGGSRTAPGGGPGEEHASATILPVVAVLGASLALSLAAFVLFYIVARRPGSAPPDEQHDK